MWHDSAQAAQGTTINSPGPWLIADAGAVSCADRFADAGYVVVAAVGADLCADDVVHDGTEFSTDGVANAGNDLCADAATVVGTDVFRSFEVLASTPHLRIHDAGKAWSPTFTPTVPTTLPTLVTTTSTPTPSPTACCEPTARDINACDADCSVTTPRRLAERSIC